MNDRKQDIFESECIEFLDSNPSLIETAHQNLNYNKDEKHVGIPLDEKM